ncbi:MAG: type III secretion system chaperone [Aeromonas veronii]
MTLQAVLDDFSTRWGFPPLRLDETRRCQLLVDDKLPLFFFEQESDDETTLMLMASIGILSLEPARRLQTLELLAQGNYAGIATGGQTLALSPDGRQLVLFGKRPLSQLSAGVLGAWLEQLTGQALGWQARLAMQEQQIPAEPPAPAQRDAIRI